MVQMFRVQPADVLAAHASECWAVGPAIAKRLRGKRLDETQAAIALGGEIVALLLRDPSAPRRRALRPWQVEHEEFQQRPRKRYLFGALCDAPERALHRFIHMPQHLAHRHLSPSALGLRLKRLQAPQYLRLVMRVV